MIRKVHAVVLFAQNFDNCVAFYEKTIGLEVVQRETSMVALRLEGQDFAIVHLSEGAELAHLAPDAFQPASPQVNRIMLCAMVENVDATYADYQSRGVEFTKPPSDQYWGIRTATFRDPEGNLWELVQPIASE